MLAVKLADLLRGAMVMDWLKDPAKFDLRREMAKVGHWGVVTTTGAFLLSKRAARKRHKVIDRKVSKCYTHTDQAVSIT